MAEPRALAMGTSHTPEVLDVARWCRAEATRTGKTFLDVLAPLADRWARDRRTDVRGRAQWVPVGWLAKDPTEWAHEAQVKSSSAVQLTPEQDQASIEDFIRAGTKETLQ